MAKSSKAKRDPLPECFASYEEAGEFWDTYSSADYEEYMIPVEVELELKPREQSAAELLEQEMRRTDFSLSSR